MGEDKYEDYPSSAPARRRMRKNDGMTKSAESRCTLPLHHQDSFHHSSPLSECGRCSRIDLRVVELLSLIGPLHDAVAESLDVGLSPGGGELQYLRAIEAISEVAQQLGYLSGAAPLGAVSRAVGGTLGPTYSAGVGDFNG